MAMLKFESRTIYLLSKKGLRRDISLPGCRSFCRRTEGVSQRQLAGFREASLLRRTEQRNGLPLVSAVDSKVLLVHRDQGMARVKLAHSNQAQIGEVSIPVRVTYG